MRRIILAVIGLVIAAVLFAGCAGPGNQALNQQRQSALNQRAQAYAKAVAAVPVPQNSNFPLRRTLVAMTERDDLLNHPWYVYILGFNGNIIGYYVAKTDPVNACDFLSSTDNITTHGDTGMAVTAAPSLDGIFYGGAGASAGCDAWVFLDEATNALIKIRGLPFYVADQPLRVAAQAITVKPK